MVALQFRIPFAQDVLERRPAVQSEAQNEDARLRTAYGQLIGSQWERRHCPTSL